MKTKIIWRRDGKEEDETENKIVIMQKKKKN